MSKHFLGADIIIMHYEKVQPFILFEKKHILLNPIGWEINQLYQNHRNHFLCSINVNCM